MSESTKESIGRIEVAPDVLVTIVHYATLRVEGISKMASVPTDAGHFFRRNTRHDGVSLVLADDKVSFDIYVTMNPDVNIMETSQKLQTAVSEAIDTMVGIPVQAINVHVEDVIYPQ